MKPTNFTRTNVAPSSVMMSSPERSSYDLSHRNNLTLPLGKFIPVNIEKLIPGTTSRIGVTPSLSLETIQTPEIGRLRLDQHTFSVSARRINRDWRLFYEGDPQYNSLPMFNVGRLMHDVLVFIGTWFRDDGDNSQRLREFLEANSSSPNPDSNPALIAYVLLSRVAGLYYAKANPTDAGNSPVSSFGYLLDFYNLESVRLNELAKTYREMSASLSWQQYLRNSLDRVHDSGYWGEELFEPAIAIYEILKPYFGEGSLFDMLGYPCLKRYSRLFYTFANVIRNSMFDDLSGRGLPLVTETSDKVYTALLSLYDSPYSFYSDIIGIDGTSVDDVLFAVRYGSSDNYSPIASEMELRAVYAAWYDQLRNWHIEKRDNVLDPDTFGKDSLLDGLSADENSYFCNIMLLLPRYCTWSKDFYTTIQTEDKFRYVFAPISPSSGTNEVVVDNSAGLSDLNTNQGLDNLLGIVNDEFESLFPSGRLFRPDPSYGSTLSTLRNDLQTMRRAGMVEKYLARTYYHPDTYVGQIQSRFGIEPSDIDIISSRYLFGQESLVQGEQVKNATGTEETPAGLRTLVAGVGNNEGTLYQNGAEFTYVISFCSLVPLVTLDPLNMHLSERYLLDLPTPEFANDTRIVISPSEFMRDCHMEVSPIGYVPRYYQYRLRADEAHGDYLTDKRAQIWLNDSYRHYEDKFMPFSVSTANLYPAYSTYLWNKKLCYALDAYDMHVHVVPDAFLNLREWDSIAYGNVDIVFETNTILPGAVDIF